MQQHGDTVAGRKIELIIRDDGGVADNAHRLVQEMIVNDKVDMSASASRHYARHRAAGDRGQEGHLLMSSGASITTDQIVHTSCAPAFLSRRSPGPSPIGRPRTARATWSLWSTTGRQASRQRPRSRPASARSAAQIVESIRLPLANPDFAPFLQRIADLKPDTAFIYFPGTAGADLRQAISPKAGLAKSGIKIIGPGDLTDDDSLDTCGDQMLGMITAGPYSASHDSPL